MEKTVKIGGFSAFWGDSANGAFQLVKQHDTIHYLVGDYLAEVTMGILGKGRTKVGLNFHDSSGKF